MLAAWLGFTRSKPGDWMTPKPPAATKPSAGQGHAEQYDADNEFEALATTPVRAPIVAFMESLSKDESSVREAYLFAGRYNPDGKLLKDAGLIESMKGQRPYTIEKIEGTAAFKSRAVESEKLMEAHRKGWLERQSIREAAMRKAREAGLVEGDGFDFDTAIGNYDPAQYTEYTPIMGGPHFKQLYLYDYLAMHARAFEMWNHNPVAKRVINILAQYSMGRGYSAIAKKGNDQQQKAWDDFDKKYGIKKKVSRFWIREFLLYGELMIDKALWQSIDPSTVWDVITDPDNIEDVYYYHQQYPTQYAQFTGKQVPGVPGAEKVKSIEFIIRQLPWDRVLHIKSQCVSNEKRGRSWLFPILGWLKRIKDLYNARVIGEWLRSSFIWDDCIDGSDSDISAHLSKYSGMPSPGSIFAHNKAIERKAMSPSQAGASAGTTDTAAEIMSLIATSIGIPKDHLNVLSQGGGNRATALVASEPFAKVIEEIKAEFEDLLTRIAEVAMEQAGVAYEDGDIEFVFPSVTKDTTSETVKNIMAGEASGYIAKDTAGQMYAAEMNITTYDYEDEQKRIGDLQKDDLTKASGVMPPDSRQPADDPDAEGGSEIHGEGKVGLKKDMGSL